jgi:hypothetical protein
VSVKLKSLLLVVTALLASGCAAGSGASSSPSQPPTTQAGGATLVGAPAADPCAGSQYARVVGCHLQVAGQLNQAINHACSSYLAPQCASTISQYQTELLAAQHDLSSVPVPAAFGQANSSLMGAIGADLTASRQALTAINAHDASGFLGAVSTHIQAGSLLMRSWSQVVGAVGG